MKDIQELLKAHTTEEGTVDYDKVTEEINNEINGIVARNVEKAEKSAYKSLEIEGVEDKDTLLTYINSQTQEPTEKILELEKAIKDREEKLTEYTSTLEDTQKQLEEYAKNSDMLSKERILLQEGILDADDRDYFLHTVNKMVNEETDFKTAWSKYKEEKSDKVQKFLNPKQVISTGTKTRGAEQTKLSGAKAILRERNPELFKDDE
jgi:hypothetical protein